MRRAKFLSTTAVLLGLSSFAPFAFSAPPSKPAARPLASPQAEHAARPMKFLPGHTFEVVTDGGGTTILRFEPPLPPNDGNLYAAMLEAIEALYPVRDRGSYLGPKLFLKRLPNGSNAIALDAEKYLYLALHVRVSDQDRRIGAMSVWRETK
jgi:hypothetical protein